MNGQALYEEFERAMLVAGCEIDTWDTLPLYDKTAWNALAAKVTWL